MQLLKPTKDIDDKSENPITAVPSQPAAASSDAKSIFPAAQVEIIKTMIDASEQSLSPKASSSAVDAFWLIEDLIDIYRQACANKQPLPKTDHAFYARLYKIKSLLCSETSMIKEQIVVAIVYANDFHAEMHHIQQRLGITKSTSAAASIDPQEAYHNATTLYLKAKHDSQNKLLSFTIALEAFSAAITAYHQLAQTDELNSVEMFQYANCYRLKALCCTQGKDHIYAAYNPNECIGARDVMFVLAVGFQKDAIDILQKLPLETVVPGTDRNVHQLLIEWKLLAARFALVRPCDSSRALKLAEESHALFLQFPEEINYTNDAEDFVDLYKKKLAEFYTGLRQHLTKNNNDQKVPPITALINYSTANVTGTTAAAGSADVDLGRPPVAPTVTATIANTK